MNAEGSTLFDLQDTNGKPMRLRFSERELLDKLRRTRDQATTADAVDHAEDLVAVVERLGRERAARNAEPPAPADLRDRAIAILDDAVGDAFGIHMPDAAAVRDLAQAAVALDHLARVDADAGGQPAINVEKLCADVWNACQEGDVLAVGGLDVGKAHEEVGSTQVADVAAAAIRKVLA